MSDNKQRGNFWKAGPNTGWRVVTKKRPRIGDVVTVQRADGDERDVVITTSAKRLGLHKPRWHSGFADVWTQAAQKAIATQQAGGSRSARRVKARRKPAPKPAPFEARRPSGCIGGLSADGARADARARGAGWTPYLCEKCQEWHAEQAE